MEINKDGKVWPPEMDTFPADPETRALLAMLEASAPQPTTAFAERLYRQVRPAPLGEPSPLSGIDRQLSKLIETFRFGLSGGYDVRRSIAALVGALVLVTAFIIAVVPSARAEMVEALRRITLGDSTEVQQIDPLPNDLPPGDYPWQMAEGTYWIVKTDVGAYGGNVSPGKDNQVTSVKTIENAEALARVRPLAPAYLPDGYSLREVKVAPGQRPIFFQFYAGPGPDIVFIQTGVGITAGDSPGTAVAAVVSTVTDGSIEEVSFDGREAAWIDGHLLKWEANGITYDIGGLGLDLDTAMAIGRSLR